MEENTVQTNKSLYQRYWRPVVIAVAVVLLVAGILVGSNETYKTYIENDYLRHQKAELEDLLLLSEEREMVAVEAATEMQEKYRTSIKKLKESNQKKTSDIDDEFEDIFAGIDTISFDSAYRKLSRIGGATPSGYNTSH